MSEAPDLNKAVYDRPNQNWLCGHTPQGCPCQRGPDAKGRCRATFECVPTLVIKKGFGKGLYVCTRSASYGGRCEAGPLPDGTCCRANPKCQPIRSIRSRRGQVSWWVAALALGVLAVVFGGQRRLKWVSPGPLTSAHQGATAAEAEGCISCHATAHQNPSEWIKTVFTTPSPEEGRAMDRQCLQCHDQGAHPMNVHSVDPLQINEWTQDAGEGISKVKTWLTGEAESSQERACASCHGEHHGADVDLAAMADQQCQACHVKQFSNFSVDHPPFPDEENGRTFSFPFKQRSGIAFDHVTHMNTHFKKDYSAEERVPVSCADCHTLDSSSNGRMLTGGFEQSCAACHHHATKLEGTAETAPIPFIQLPGIDLKSAKKGGIDLSFWKADRRHGSKEVHPILKLLITGADVYPGPDYPATNVNHSFTVDLEVIHSLRKGFTDLRKATSEQLQAVERIAHAIRYLFEDLSAHEGLEGIQFRVERALDRSLTHEELADITQHFPLAELKQKKDEWFEGSE